MKILFFTPFAGRNGAEMMLWYIIKHIDKTKITCALICNQAGPLIDGLPDSVSYFVPPAPPELSLRQRVTKKIKNKIIGRSQNNYSYKAFVTTIHEDFKPDLWYINTILCPEAVDLANELKIPYVVHFHDLLFIYQHITYTDLKSAITGASLLVGCSQIVCDRLEILGGRNIALQYGCVDIAQIKIDERRKELIKLKLGMTNSFNWVMSGSVEYRKGTDLIPAIAKALGKSVNIIWLGPGSSGYSYYIEQELKFYGLDNVYMLGPKSDDYYDYLSLADGLVLTSREDPFPLVMIEAAAMGLPIVSFNSGGVSEFVKEGMGIVTKSFDVNELVNAMKKVILNEIGFKRETAIERAKEFDAQVQAQLWQEMIISKNLVS